MGGRFRFEDNIKNNLNEIVCGNMNSNHVTQNMNQWPAFVSTAMDLQVVWEAQNSLTEGGTRLLKDASPGQTEGHLKVNTTGRNNSASDSEENQGL